MAAEVVGGAFLSASIDVLVRRLVSPEVLKFIQRRKLEGESVKRLKTTLYAVKALLNDAEHKQIKDVAVKKWLDDLKDAVYQADDLLDEISTRAATEKEVRNFILRYLNSSDKQTVNKLDDIIERLEGILKHKDILALKESVAESWSLRTQSTSLVIESDVYGRDGDREAILRMLLSDDGVDRKISVIPIVGMGGVGKTTLAQLVYNDDHLKQKFDLRAWVCVSEVFDVCRITKTILNTITCAYDIEDLNLLQIYLKQKLKGKKILIVLDDVWNEDYIYWDIFQRPFHYGTEVSKIVVTTRSEKVASIVGTVPSYHLSQLSDEDGRLLFARHAFPFKDSIVCSSLEKIGRDIVKKCKGLPLAIKTLGSLLRSKPDIQQWNFILKNDTWELPENESTIIPALRISYQYLPSNLKQCFAYCSIFPKDYEFEKEELILLWMAEGLLQPPRRGVTLEEVGSSYFDELTSRSFFQHSQGMFGCGCFFMHDLIHDLATSIAREFCFRLDDDNANEISRRTRHLSYNTDKSGYMMLDGFKALSRAKSLRTLLLLSSSDNFVYLGKVPAALITRLECLRVLSFRNCQSLESIPESIGTLIHLRYLDLSRTKVNCLPETISKLCNLQTLKLEFCHDLTMLPNGINNLANLQYLDVRNTGVKKMPRGMSKLKRLQFLSDFILGEDEGARIEELHELSNLQKSLRISNLQYVENSHQAFRAGMMDKEQIGKLSLVWTNGDDKTDSQSERDILDKLQPHTFLQSLSIECFGGTKFPHWLGHQSYCNITILFLYDCKYCCLMPPLGQLPSLKNLYIGRFDELEVIGSEFYIDGGSSLLTPFASLEVLEFNNMPAWHKWCNFEKDAFPNLQELNIFNCPCLTGDLPNPLPVLERLQIEKCQRLASSLQRVPTICELEIIESENMDLQVLPPSMYSLSIIGERLVGSVLKAMLFSEIACLQNLYLSGCSSALAFPGGCIPASVKRLTITDCKKLEFPQNQSHKFLCSLTLCNSCESLTTFSIDLFPNLRDLYIDNCKNLKFLLVKDHLQNIQRITISKCPKFAPLPDSMTSLLPNLKELELEDCVKIPNLKELELEDCVKIESFLEGDFSLNLSSTSWTDWHLMSLSLLSITAYDSVKSFPEKDLLPATLTTLSIGGFSSLEMLDCKGFLHLASLKDLYITGCPKLEKIEGEKLPASLIMLLIEECPLLAEGLNVKNGEIWPKVSHISAIHIDKKRISCP